MVIAEVSARESQQSNAAESEKEPIRLLIQDEVTGDILLLNFTLDDVFNRSKWKDAERPSVILQQKKRARKLP